MQGRESEGAGPNLASPQARQGPASPDAKNKPIAVHNSTSLKS